jgi:hypothetical protein
MTAQIPGPASEWVISATQPFLADPDRSSAPLHYPSTKGKIPWFLFASNLELIGATSNGRLHVAEVNSKGSINTSDWLDARKWSALSPRPPPNAYRHDLKDDVDSDISRFKLH